MGFAVSVENKPEDLKLEYEWEVSAGKIMSGQGTPTIEVDTKDLSDINVTASVEIKGLPENCPKTFSETGTIGMQIIDNCLDGYGKLSEVEEAGRLDSFIIQLRNDANLLVRFDLRFPAKATAKQIDARISRIAKQFAYRRAADEIRRIIFVISAEAGEDYTGVCYFPLSSKDAYCDKCEIIKGVDLDLNKYSKSKRPKK